MNCMRGRVRGISTHEVQPLSEGWDVAATAPGAIDRPEVLERSSLDWLRTVAPSTAASSLRAAGRWDLSATSRRFDAEDWWYRVRFGSETPVQGEEVWLCFDGLATVADVWLNGQPLLTSQGMFTAHERRIDALLQRDNELVIRFRSLDALLRERRPRPRWRAPMVENQQIRWFRTTLLGRTPGWSPPAQAVGPWRPVRIERRRGATVDDVRLRATGDGRLDVSCRVTQLTRGDGASGQVIVSREGRAFSAELRVQGDRLVGQLAVPGAEKWWPHTHGASPLYTVRAVVRTSAGTSEVDLGSIGFRSVGVNTADDGFAVFVNRAPVFCRGACWTPLDAVALTAEVENLDDAFQQVVDSHMNMLRVGGMMVYEDDSFLDRCDARGVLLWQDFMFSNMEYPEEDAGFMNAVRVEVAQQLARLQGRPSLAVLCGNSEGEQQAAMWGAPRERWQVRLFHDHLAAIAKDACPDVPYWPSSAHRGAFPHQGDAGTSSYYGVGAYLRPLEDARRARIRFASECLAFANIPEPGSMADLPGGQGTKVHDASWRSRAPRDLGAGWDFDDVRDHYVEQLFRVDLLQLRYGDHERYLALGRVATGEVMAQVFSEWRRRRSPTRGGLVWFLRDLWSGAGWGVIDANGTPKAAWHYLRRALAPVAVSLSDEGGNGMGVHVINDGPTPLRAELEITLYRFGEVQVARGARTVSLEARSAIEMNAALFFEDFVDVSYAYRFGPPSHDVVVAALRGDNGEVLTRDFHFVPGLPNAREMDVGLDAALQLATNGGFHLAIRTRKLAQSVHIELDGFTPDDNYFHMAPGDQRRLALRPSRRNTERKVPRGAVHALNSTTSATITGPEG